MKIKRRTLKYMFVLILILLLVYLVSQYLKKDQYTFKDSRFSYSENKGKPSYEILLRSSNETFDMYSVNFKSRDFMDYETKIYGRLFMPKGKDNVPGLVLLPGGGVTKESEITLAGFIASLGYAVLTIDQRGLGETGGIYLGLEQDYAVFKEGKEPINHLSVFDGLRAYDVLKEIKGVDKNNIAIAGESMGGRYAVIAAAIDKRLKGVIAISSSGFHVKDDSSNPYNSYLLSIDIDNYISSISPNPVIMIHGTNDTTVPLESARFTFNLAKEPKKFFIAEGCGHGYCDAMKKDLENSLNEIFWNKK